MRRKPTQPQEREREREMCDAQIGRNLEVWMQVVAETPDVASASADRYDADRMDGAPREAGGRVGPPEAMR